MPGIWYIEQTAAGCTVITEEAQQGLLLLILGRRERPDLLAAARGLGAIAEEAGRMELAGLPPHLGFPVAPHRAAYDSHNIDYGT